MTSFNHSSITRNIVKFIAIVFAMLMATACGNIAGTTMPNGNAQQPAVAQNAHSTTVNNGSSQQPSSTVSSTTFGNGSQVDIIVDKPN